MKLKPQSADIQNFMSVGEKITFPLDIPGLVLIVGNNEDDPNSDSNGAGKSVPLDAVTWCWWGKTIRGDKGDDVIHEEKGKDCFVTVHSLDGAKAVKITRTRNKSGVEKPNDLILEVDGVDLSGSTAEITQKKVDGIIGMDYDTFCAMMPGAGVSMATMTDKDIKTLIENILRTNEVSAAQEIAAERAKETQHLVTSKETEISLLKNTLSSCMKRLEQAKQDQQTSKDDRVAKAAEFVALAVQQAADLVDLRSFCNVEAAKDKLTEAQEFWKETNKKVQDARSRLKAATAKLEEAKRTYTATYTKFKTTKDLLVTKKKNINSLAECPTCLSSVQPAHKASVCSGLDKEIAEVDQKLATLEANKDALFTKLQDKLSSIQAEETKLDSQLAAQEKHRLELNKALIQATQNRATYEALEASIYANDQAAKDLLAQDDSAYDKMVESLEAEHTELSTKIEEEEKTLLDLQKQLAMLKYWQKSFSPTGFRSQMMEAVVPYLDERAEYYCQLLTKGALSVTFSTKTAQKNGKIADKFKVQVSHTHGASRWTGSSKGERKRVELVLAMVTGDLAALRSSKHLPFRFMDEPFENIDESGTEAIIALLEDQKHKYESVYVVTHNNDFKKLFPTEMVMKKKNGFTTLESVHARTDADSDS